MAAERIAYDYEHLPTIQNRLKAARTHSKEDQAVVRLGLQCEQESQRLMQMLGAREIDPNTKGGKRIAKAIKIAIKTVRGRKDVERSRENLIELNAQLSTAILQAMYVKEGKAMETQQHLPIGETTSLPVLPRKDNDKIDFLIDWQKGALRRRRMQDIIRSLRFDTVADRWDAIDRAYPRTYEWALSSRSLRLRRWLEAGTGLFWVTGKAGSGKSTLMKFLCKHEQTKVLLERWSGATDITIASYFFWYAGTTLQKSITGLLRTICSQILIDQPELAAEAFPGLFEAVEYGDGAGMTFEWEYENLVQGLLRMASLHTAGTPRRKYCIFIDGLDEYHGDHLELIALLKELAANEVIKLCVSSRPWNAFRNAFGSEIPQLRLEHVSRPDIERYTSGKIRSAFHCSFSSETANDREQVIALVEEIVQRAEGVFLWVVLVVQSVVSGLAEGDPLFMLRHRVQQFPTDLDLFFKKILGRIDTVYKPQTHQLLKLAFMFAQEGDQMQALSTFVDYWLIGQSAKGLDRSEFACELPLTTLSPEKMSEMIKRTQSMLGSACKDLLYVAPAVGKHRIFPRVEFLHRTVYDFLQSDEMQQLLDECLPNHFKSLRIFHLLNLARLKFRPDEACYLKRLDGARTFMESGLEWNQLRIGDSLKEPVAQQSSSSDSSHIHEWVHDARFTPLFDSHSWLGKDLDFPERSKYGQTSRPRTPISPALPFRVRSEDSGDDRKSVSSAKADYSSDPPTSPRVKPEDELPTSPVVEDILVNFTPNYLEVESNFTATPASGLSSNWESPAPFQFCMPGKPGYGQRHLVYLSAIFGTTGKLSIEAAHHDLNERYLESFADTVMHCGGSSGLSRYLAEHPDQLRCFLAFPNSNVALGCLTSYNAEGVKSRLNQVRRESFFLAALGEDPLNPFELEHANISVIEKLCQLCPRDYWPSVAAGCYSNSWQLFIRKWALFTMNSTYTDMSIPDRDELTRHFWELAKVFLYNGSARYGSTFCANPSPKITQDHRHERRSIVDFLRMHVPQTWLSEVEATQCQTEESIAPTKKRPLSE